MNASEENSTALVYDDIKKRTIDQQQAKMDTYIALVIKGLPVPMDLKAEAHYAASGVIRDNARRPGESAGPRNLPQPSERKRRRREVRESRRRNRGAYSGQ